MHANAGIADPVLRVLFADDCPDTISTLHRLCKLLGFDSLGVRDGLAAVEIAEHYRPHIIFMDLSMPHLDGYEGARRIREQSRGRDVVLVAMTGWSGDEFERKALQAGFDHFWLKPIYFDAMRSLFTSVQRKLLSVSSAG